MSNLTQQQHRQLMIALESLDKDYDQDARMLALPFHSPGYHSTLTGGIVHPTRATARYAVALLDSEQDRRLERAIDVLDKMISLQDRRPDSPTCGVWSWFLEEPLEKMSPPDWNWADFIGVQLLQVAVSHADRLPKALAERLRDSILHAAGCIQQRFLSRTHRTSVGPGYTNIAVMGTYVTNVAGELYDVADLREHADFRLRRIHEYTLEQDSFTEYNSPTYSVIAICELVRMMMHIRSREARDLVNELHDLAWRDVARRFHPPTMQWAGPHSRSYSTLLGEFSLAFLQRALGGAVRFLPEGRQELPSSTIEFYRLELSCPDKYVHCFRDLPQPRNEDQVFFKGTEQDPPRRGYTRLEPRFALSSANFSVLGNQSRPLLAYWNGGSGPAAMQVRFLHDGYDFSSAFIFTEQFERHVLAGISFATDGGDTNLWHDKIKDAAISATDLRLRFKLFNMPDDWPLPDFKINGTNVIDLGAVRLAIAISQVHFGTFDARTEVKREGANVYLDVVLYAGERRRVDLRTIAPAFVVFGLSMSPKDAGDIGLPEISVETSEEDVGVHWPVGESGQALSLDINPRPVSIRELVKRVRL